MVRIASATRPAQRHVFGLIDRCSVKELFAQLDGMDDDRAQPHVAAHFVVIDWCAQLFLVCIPPADGIAHQAQEEKRLLADGVVVRAKRAQQAGEIGDIGCDSLAGQFVKVAEGRPPPPRRMFSPRSLRRSVALFNGRQRIPHFRIRKNAKKAVRRQGYPALRIE